MAIQIEEVSKRFEGIKVSVEALRPISITIEDGEFVSVIGPSGCGKSTLLRLIAGLVPPTTGTIRLDGETVDAPSSKTGFAFQTPVMLKWRTVFKNVMFPYEVLARRGEVQGSREQYEQLARELLTLVGLDGFEDAYPKELSGGMQQRVAICRALIHDPQVLLMDEPFGALDEFNREKMNVELLRIWEETRKTVVFVTHNIGEAVFLSDRVMVMSSRPGQLRGVVDIELPRPRPEDVVDRPEFLDHVVAVRSLLREHTAETGEARILNG